MLQTSDIRQRFGAIERAIGQAAQACSAERDVPGELRACIDKLDKQSDLTRQVLQTDDEPRIRKMLGELELLGNRARQVCASSKLTPQMKSAVSQVHDQLAALRQELH